MDIVITLNVPDTMAHTVATSGPHTCAPDCDCPTALARTQEAIDAARTQEGRPQRGLSERLLAMRYAAPGTAWFEAMAQEAVILETRAATRILKDKILQQQPGTEAAAWVAAGDAHDAMTPQQRAVAMHAAVEQTVTLLERAALLPLDHEYVLDPNVGQSRVYAGNLKFVADMTGSLDTPANQYLVTTSRDDDDQLGQERFTVDLNTVRAWLLAWAAEAAFAARDRNA